jgi:hypothetical protein
MLRILKVNCYDINNFHATNCFSDNHCHVLNNNWLESVKTCMTSRYIHFDMQTVEGVFNIFDCSTQ